MNDNFYYSLDKLVDFGLNLAVAQQMVQSMNSTISNMTVPGVNNPMQPNKESVYYVAINGKAEGPYSATELARLVVDGKVVKETYIWKPGMTKWDLAENLADVLQLVALVPPPIPNS